MLTRDTALINNLISLYVNFYSGGSLIDVNEVLEVEIYNSDPSVGGLTPIQTTTGITHTSTGTYNYVVGPFVTEGWYYDKVTYVPTAGADPETTTQMFHVKKIEGVSSLGIPTCLLYGTVIDIKGEPLENALVTVNKVDFQSEKESRITAFKAIETETDINGYFQVYVLTGIKFAISIPAIGYRRIFVIENGTIQKNIVELDSWLYPPVDNPGEANNYLGTSSGIVRPSSTGYYTGFEKETNMPVFDWK